VAGKGLFVGTPEEESACLILSQQVQQKKVNKFDAFSVGSHFLREKAESFVGRGASKR
jgi:hypothetical protein